MAEQLDQQLPATRNLHESLSRAEELATRRKHSVVGLDHLLLALGQDPEAVAVLLVCKVDVEALCMDLLRKLGPEARMRSPNTVPPSFDVTVQNLIAHASAAALQAGHTEIDGSNILSAIISGEGGMITHKILQKHGLTFNETVLNLENKKQNENEKQIGLKQQEETKEAKSQPDNDQTESYKLVPEVSGKDEVREQKSEQPSQQGVANKTKEPSVSEAAIEPQGDKKNQGPLESIVQAEARPEDYGMTVEGREYHPVPPKAKQPLPKGGNVPHQEASNPHLNVQNQNQVHAGGQPPIKQEAGLETAQKGKGQPQTLRQAENVPPHKMQNGMPASVNIPSQGNIQAQANMQGQVNRPPAQAIRPPQQQGVNEQEPLPSILNNKGPQGVRAETPSPDEQSEAPQAAGRKVSFKKAEFAQPQDKFIKEDKYGNTPPSLPISPQPGSEERNDQRNDLQNGQRDGDLSESANSAPKIEGKEEAPIRTAQNAMPPHFPQIKEPKLNEQTAISRGLMDQAPLNLPPIAREGMPLKQEQFPAKNMMPPQGQQQPVHPGQPPLPHGGYQHSQTQEKMDGIANSIAQNQKNREILGDQDQVIENIPKVMRVGKVHYLEVRVAKFANTEIELAPEDYGLRSKQNSNNPLTKAITVRLTGPDGLFLIDCATASTQWTEMQGGITNDADFAVWRWRVLPRKSGVSKLRLDVTARTSNEDGLTAEIPIQPSKSIDIKVTRNYGSIFKKLILITGIFVVGFGVAQYGQQTYELVQEQIKEFSRKD
ncbi:MAG: Clp protease N-terminal domain-containing protein [Hyphomicrobiales bacterium]